MKIGIDARTILNPEKNPGIGVGHYTFQLIRHLLEIDKKNEYELYFDYKVREKDAKKFSRKNVKVKYFPWSDYKKFMPGAYSEILGLATLLKNDLDVLHVASPNMRVPIGYRGKVVCTFQDLSIFKHPDHFHRGPGLLRSRYNHRAMAKRSNKIIAVSENTKKDIGMFFDVPDEKVVVINNGVDDRFFDNTEINEKRLREGLKKKFGIEKKYILFVGTLEPIKNITRLINAFSLFKNKNQKKDKARGYQLILAGKRGWLADEYFQIAKDFWVEEDVKFLGYVEGDELMRLFRGANLFVMPSLYEGFGMTVLEAMATGTPSLVSNIDPLKKIAGDAVKYVDPMDTEGIARKMSQLIESEEEKSKMAEEGILQAKKFSWKKCAEKTLEAYEKVAESKK